MRLSRRTQIAWISCAVAVLFYVAAWFAPAIDFGPTPEHGGGPEDFRPHGVMRGFHALGAGPVMVALMIYSDANGKAEVDVAGLGWLANPVGLIGLILLACRVPILAAVFGIVAAGMCLSYLVCPYGRPLVGAYLWLASMLIVVLGAAATFWVGRRARPAR